MVDAFVLLEIEEDTVVEEDIMYHFEGAMGCHSRLDIPTDDTLDVNIRKLRYEVLLFGLNWSTIAAHGAVGV